MGKFYFSTRSITKILTTPLESIYCLECSNEPESNVSTIDNIVGGDHGQGKFKPDFHCLIKTKF